MAKRTKITTNKSVFSVFGGVPWRTVFIAAGVAVVAPYFLRRFMPMLDGRIREITGRDVTLAGKDSVRDVADDLNVGGVSGTIERGIDRVTDRLTH
jgi:hypothetical protein